MSVIDGAHVPAPQDPPASTEPPREKHAKKLRHHEEEASMYKAKPYPATVRSPSFRIKQIGGHQIEIPLSYARQYLAEEERSDVTQPYMGEGAQLVASLLGTKSAYEKLLQVDRLVLTELRLSSKEKSDWHDNLEMSLCLLARKMVADYALLAARLYSVMQPHNSKFAFAVHILAELDPENCTLPRHMNSQKA